MNTATRLERPSDVKRIFEVNRQAFDRDDEALLVNALRDGGFARISLVAECEGQIVGHILFSRLPIVTATGIVEALSLAPMAVLPAWQRQGNGSKLVEEGLKACTADGHTIVVVLGHAEFYPRFGFSPKLAEPLATPFSGNSWMALELVPGVLSGVEGQVAYPPPFGV